MQGKIARIDIKINGPSYIENAYQAAINYYERTFNQGVKDFKGYIILEKLTFERSCAVALPEYYYYQYTAHFLIMERGEDNSLCYEATTHAPPVDK